MNRGVLGGALGGGVGSALGGPWGGALGVVSFLKIHTCEFAPILCRLSEIVMVAVGAWA